MITDEVSDYDKCIDGVDNLKIIRLNKSSIESNLLRQHIGMILPEKRDNKNPLLKTRQLEVC